MTLQVYKYNYQTLQIIINSSCQTRWRYMYSESRYGLVIFGIINNFSFSKIVAIRRVLTDSTEQRVMI